MTKVASTQYDARTGQYFPAIITFDGLKEVSNVRCSPSSFEKGRAYEIARQILKEEKNCLTEFNIDGMS